jgi:hypothetical protein
MKYIILVGYIGVIIAANWSISQWGIITIGFGLMAPAGVYWAGLAFSLRDALHEISGKTWVVGAILVGALLSGLLEDTQRIALASGTAFLVSELADLAVYTPLRKRGKVVALATSNAVGLAIDSALFLWLAFGSLDFIQGQIVAKAYMTGGVIALMLVWRYRRWISTWAPTFRSG